MPEPRTLRRLFFCGASLLALTISASHSLFAQAPLANQYEVPPDAKAYGEAIRLPDPERRIDALERFLVDYPQSRYAAGIPNLIFDLLIKDGQKEKILAQANRIIDKAPENAKSVAYYTVAAKLLRAGILLDEAEVFAVKAVSTFKVGEVYEASGDKSKARDFYGQSLRHWQAMGKRREEAHILNHLGAIHSDLGEKREALDYYQKALQASRAAKASDEEAIALKRIGQLSSEK